MKRLTTTLLTAAMLLAGTSAFADEKEGTIAKRKENQQQRIAQGVKSGALTPKETANLQNKEAKINQETHLERKANGGTLTAKEKAQVNRQQNRVSKSIYNQKHDAQTQPK